MKKIIPKSFFRKSAIFVAQNLIGKVLARKIGNKEIRLFITETEAYEGPRDLASHASRGKTKRNEPMFREGGCFYAYLVYGMHWMLNIVSGKKDYPSAVLIRGAGNISGPGKLAKILKITGKQNGKLASKKTGLWFEENTNKIIEKIKIIKTPRIGVAYAGPIWSAKKYRFIAVPNKKAGEGHP